MILGYYFLLIPTIIFILGLITGGLSNATSGGAGVLTIYVLTAYAGLVYQSADATVLASSTIFVLVGAISFYRKRQVHTQLALTVGLSGVLGAFVGATLTLHANSTDLERGFGIFTLGLAGYTTYLFYSEWSRKKKNKKNGQIQSQQELIPEITGGSDGSPRISPEIVTKNVANSAGRFSGRDPVSLAVQIAKGVLIGLVTGIFGVSLASLSVVLFIILFKLDMKLVLGTSLFASFLRYAGGALAFVNTGQINMEYFLLLTVSGIAGSLVGAKMILSDKKGSLDIYIKLIIILMLLFISYEFLLKFYLPPI